MTKTELYVVRHGKTMFNTIQRVQGWCDTPLTLDGTKRIHALGKGLRGHNFVAAYSSDSGRAIETARIILSELESGPQIPYHLDPRIREWCFGSLEGGYDAEMWGLIPRVLDFDSYDEMIANKTSFEDICNGIYRADTANWAETYDQLASRIKAGFEDIAHHIAKNGGGKALVVSHGLTIALLLHLINEENNVRIDIDNGSITRLTYEDGKFTIHEIADRKYFLAGEKITE